MAVFLFLDACQVDPYAQEGHPKTALDGALADYVGEFWGVREFNVSGLSRDQLGP